MIDAVTPVVPRPVRGAARLLALDSGFAVLLLTSRRSGREGGGDLSGSSSRQVLHVASCRTPSLLHDRVSEAKAQSSPSRGSHISHNTQTTDIDRGRDHTAPSSTKPTDFQNCSHAAPPPHT
ncbi:hypothetical protein G7K_1880-t1 [Saitoella complicata NRRL Y-17804]|uniref:Uncharacterized protein n=1 Tax=Saitoella complicata (strain BCRC 22490 / CBS 7301 / JCM 7358 / NBRC 10748 / NRRL Y-17804) TaxID=698492 RepID=A0A0E9ND88_SAICN|nr:hypothetical protein G7K_1880-t1 [Saitoella complicata NRRL Y-17804]